MNKENTYLGLLRYINLEFSIAMSDYIKCTSDVLVHSLLNVALYGIKMFLAGC